MLPAPRQVIVQHISPFPTHKMDSKIIHVVHDVHHNHHSDHTYLGHHYDQDTHGRHYHDHASKTHGSPMTSREYGITLTILAIGIGCFVASFFVKLLWLLIIGIVLTVVTVLYMISRTNTSFDGCFCVCCFDLSDCGDICGDF